MTCDASHTETVEVTPGDFITGHGFFDAHEIVVATTSGRLDVSQRLSAKTHKLGHMSRAGQVLKELVLKAKV